jgi:hypothetical protein
MKEPQLNPQVADLEPTGPELTVYDEEHWREVCRIVLRIDPDTRGRPGATSIRKPPLACQMDDRARLSPSAAKRRRLIIATPASDTRDLP